ncbi:MAG: hypothetical protein Q7S08_00765 [bacterium]|nr:hypothetical protein [bacterium]
MKEEFTSAEEQEFVRLLKKIQQNEYWVPSLQAWQEVQRTFSRWAAEIVIADKDGVGTPRILLSRYAGEGVPEHRGNFHIAGGFEKFPESIKESCSRIAQNELGVDVEYQGVLGIHKWTSEESPIGSHLLSVFVACRPLSAITLQENRRLFTREEMLALGPKDMVQNHPHRAFADQYLKQLESGDPVSPL